MDSTDYKIMEILLEDGRIPMKELAQKVSLSPPAVAERVKRLEEEEIITGYKAVLNYSKLGKKISVLINVGMNLQKNVKFMEFIKNEEAIIECHQVTGPHNKVLKARIEDIGELEKLIGRIQMFGSTETFVMLSSIEKEHVVSKERNI
jgi:Lrp/AsnC family leucine-responsive transcriptional regulator